MRRSRVLLVWLGALAVLATAAQTGVVVAPSRAAARPVKTIVSIQFDDGNRQQVARAILKKHHMHGTFFINTGYIGTGNGYFTWKQLRELAADGNEIAGHTLTHRDLATLSPGEQAREICIDRRQLIQHGLRPVDFAYPFGSYDATTERAVRRCGYQSGRAAWGLWGSGCEQTPHDCPYSVDPANMPDRWAIPTADAPIDLTYLIHLQADVTRAEQHGGGWVQIFWHRLCPDDCEEYSWSPALLDDFLTWLQKRSGRGTVVMTSQQVLHERWRGRAAELAAIHAPAPPPPPAGPNALRNPGLERFDPATGAPVCWELTGSGSWSRVPHGAGHAEQVVIAGAPDGYAAIAQPLDQGECAPAVTGGQRLRVSAAYRSLDAPRFVVWARNAQGGWAFWTDSPRLGPATGFRRTSWDLPPVPRGVTALSVGVALNGTGRAAVDDLALTAR
jgi:peptidoglycan/xylan/chitin deacetylase (PgdA/CDA1 family)